MEREESVKLAKFGRRGPTTILIKPRTGLAFVDPALLSREARADSGRLHSIER